MKNARLIVLVLVLALTATVFFSTDFGRRDRIGAGLPLESAGKPVLVQLMSEGCAACRQMEPVLDAVRNVYADKVDVVLRDVFAQPGISRAYGITMIPAQIFIDHQGREHHRQEGVMTEAQVFAVLDELLTEH